MLGIVQTFFDMSTETDVSKYLLEIICYRIKSKSKEE